MNDLFQEDMSRKQAGLSQNMAVTACMRLADGIIGIPEWMAGITCARHSVRQGALLDPQPEDMDFLAGERGSPVGHAHR